MKKLLVLVAVCLGLTLITGSVLAKPPTDRNSNVEKSMGQTLYLPLAYMDISGQDQQVFQGISTKILIRNTDPNNPITIKSIAIYDPDGQFIVDMVDPNAPVTLGPLASTTYDKPSVIPFNDPSILGRHCTLVTWQADSYVTHPNIGAAFTTFINDGFSKKITSFTNTSGKIIE